MGFSAIIAAAGTPQANTTLEAQGYGEYNFSVPLWRDDDPIPAAYGMNVAAEALAFQSAVEAIPGVSIREAAPGTVEFDQHVADEGLKRAPTEAPSPV